MNVLQVLKFSNHIEFILNNNIKYEYYFGTVNPDSNEVGSNITESVWPIINDEYELLFPDLMTTNGKLLKVEKSDGNIVKILLGDQVVYNSGQEDDIVDNFSNFTIS